MSRDMDIKVMYLNAIGTSAYDGVFVDMARAVSGDAFVVPCQASVAALARRIGWSDGEVWGMYPPPERQLVDLGLRAGSA